MNTDALRELRKRAERLARSISARGPMVASAVAPVATVAPMPARVTPQDDLQLAKALAELPDVPDPTDEVDVGGSDVGGSDAANLIDAPVAHATAVAQDAHRAAAAEGGTHVDTQYCSCATRIVYDGRCYKCHGIVRCPDCGADLTDVEHMDGTPCGLGVVPWATTGSFGSSNKKKE